LVFLRKILNPGLTPWCELVVSWVESLVHMSQNWKVEGGLGHLGVSIIKAVWSERELAM